MYTSKIWFLPGELIGMKKIRKRLKVTRMRRLKDRVKLGYPMDGRTPMTPVEFMFETHTPFKNNHRRGCFQLTEQSLTLVSGRGEGQPMEELL